MKADAQEVRWVGAQGRGGQYVRVVPELDLVVAVTAGYYQDYSVTARERCERSSASSGTSYAQRFELAVVFDSIERPCAGGHLPPPPWTG